MQNSTTNLPSRTAGIRPLQPLERFVRDYVELSGGAWDEIEPQVYDLLLDGDEAARITFDPEALPEHPSSQLASLGSPLVERLLDDARKRGAHTVLYATGLNPHPHDLVGKLRRAFAIPPKSSIAPTSARLCFFPQAAYRFVATFLSDRKEQATLEISLDLHAGREVRHLARLLDDGDLAGRPVEPLPEAPHLPLQAGFALACRQVARSLVPLVNRRRRELTEHTGRQIARMEQYYAQMLEEVRHQPRRVAGADPIEALARRKSREDAIQRERVLRITELRQKSTLRVTLALSHVQVIHLPKLLVRFDLVTPRGKPVGLESVFDLLTEAFDPVSPASGAPPTFDLRSIAH